MRFITEPQHDLTYNDVFLVPSRSDLTSRFDVDIAATDNTGAQIPIVASNMNGVTGRRMAETLARRGGLSVLPQDIPLDMAQEVTGWIKSRNSLYETPLHVTLTDRVLNVQYLLQKRNHGAVCVVDETENGQELLGVIRADDVKEIDQFSSVESVMRTPAMVIEESTLTNTADTTDKLVSIYEDMYRHQVDYAPVVSGRKLRGVLTLAGVMRSSIFSPTLDDDGRLKVAAAIGINGDVRGKAEALVSAGVDVLVVDTAHGHQRKMLEALEKVSDLPVSIVAGNVVSADGTRELISAGADIVKVGVGPGAMCTTRMMTAVGRPQFSAVLECAAAAAETGNAVWADGGVKYPRDVALALAAGASQVMIGSWFAGTLESPGDLFADASGRRYKENFGMASARAVSARTQNDDIYARARKAMFEEGISRSKMYIDEASPSVEDLIDSITAGVRSSMTYAGAESLEEFRKRAVVGIQSVAGYNEGRAVAESW